MARSSAACVATGPLADLARREAKLAGERRTLERKQAKELAELNERLEQAEHEYRAALKAWPG